MNYLSGKSFILSCCVPFSCTDPGKNRHLKNLLYTIIPCVVFGLVVGMVIIAVCWKHHKQSPDFMKKTTLPTITVFLPEVGRDSYTNSTKKNIKQNNYKRVLF